MAPSFGPDAGYQDSPAGLHTHTTCEEKCRIDLESGGQSSFHKSETCLRFNPSS